MNITVAVSLLSKLSNPQKKNQTIEQNEFDACGGMLAKTTSVSSSMNEATIQNIPLKNVFNYDGCGGVLAQATPRDKAMLKTNSKQTIITGDGCGGLLAEETVDHQKRFQNKLAA